MEYIWQAELGIASRDFRSSLSLGISKPRGRDVHEEQHARERNVEAVDPELHRAELDGAAGRVEDHRCGGRAVVERGRAAVGLHVCFFLTPS